jgi:WD40 repeat protein
LKVERARFSPDARRVVTTSEDGRARVWDAASGEELPPPRNERVVVGAAFSPEGRRIVTTAGDTTTRIWDATTGEEPRD